ncbi:MAG TPA: retropepsin-like aspartic protease [Thermodesulfovibrionia bacterium]|nr:retropepsin-like aspartic protease [Thermodesulfovibrionia bacterium]
MNIQINDGLPFTEVTLIHRGKTLTLDRVLIDTGSAGTIFDVDVLAKIDLLPEPEDSIHTITGVGGSEFVVEKKVEQIKIMSLEIADFTIEIGTMDYGLELHGIIGFNFLIRTKAIIDPEQLKIYSNLS